MRRALHAWLSRAMPAPGGRQTAPADARARRRLLGGVGVASLLALGGALPGTLGGADDPAVTVRVDASAGRRPIDPLIYGVAHATDAQLAELNAPLNRHGGNHASRYNWRINAYNRGRDWYFESIGEPSPRAGERIDRFIAESRAAGAEPLITVPMLGWVARLGARRERLASFSIAKYGAQAAWDQQWFPDAGDGFRRGGEPVTGNDPGDASVAVDAAFQREWVEHLVARWGGAANGGVRYYTMDNEPSLWFATHRDVRPVGATMDEIRSRLVDHAAAVKSADPSARVVGPEEWGWPGYLYSGYDQQWAAGRGWAGPLPDRTANGGRDYLPWLLERLREHHAATGQRVLDVVSVHYYPQGGEYPSGTTAALQLLRNRSTRSLWDPDYSDESWIRSRVQLIPRLRQWVDVHYLPGTRIAITEYSWGADAHISGAIAQADVLGIFGREGLDMAARWRTPERTTPTFKAMALYRNYDGNRSTFGDVSVSASGPNPDEVAVFAAERSQDGALTVMVLNKRLSGRTPVRMMLANVAHAGAAQRWQLTAANVVTRLPDLEVAGNAVSTSLPSQSITLFVLHARTASGGPGR